MAVPMVSSAEGIAFGGFRRLVASFCAAGVALRDVQDVFCNTAKVVLCGRRNTFATFSGDALHFSWQAQHFGDHPSSFCMAGAALIDVSVLRVFLRISIVRAASSGDKVQIPGQAVAFCEMR